MNLYTIHTGINVFAMERKCEWLNTTIIQLSDTIMPTATNFHLQSGIT